MKPILLASTTAAVLAAANLGPAMAQATKPASQVVEWNRTLLVIVRTPGAQPATIHPTRSFAIMHAAIYDAVNAIDGTHKPYLIRVSASHFASQEAAAAGAAHEVLGILYPNFQATLDTQFQQALAQLPSGGRGEGIRIGKTVADRILALRTNDGSNAQPIPYVFGNAPGDYQSTPPNFPKQPQFTHWSRVTPFALERANQFRPGGPPNLTSDRYSDAFDQVKSLGIAGSTTATADEARTGRFWNGAIQNYWNEIAQTASLAHDLTTAENARLFALLNLSFADAVIAFYDAKYAYNFWRPVTAIRAAVMDGNPDNEADPNWLPEVGNTTPDQILMPCSPQNWQRYIWAYQPTPYSSKPSCGVSSPQSRQNRQSRSAWLPDGISLRQVWYDAVHQSSSAAIIRCQRLKCIPLSRPGGSVGARPTRSRMFRKEKGRERASIASSNETPTSLH